MSGRAVAGRGGLAGEPGRGWWPQGGAWSPGGGRGAVAIPWLQAQLGSERQARATCPALASGQSACSLG